MELKTHRDESMSKSGVVRFLDRVQNVSKEANLRTSFTLVNRAAAEKSFKTTANSSMARIRSLVNFPYNVKDDGVLHPRVRMAPDERRLVRKSESCSISFRQKETHCFKRTYKVTNFLTLFFIQKKSMNTSGSSFGFFCNLSLPFLPSSNLDRVPQEETTDTFLKLDKTSL